MKIGIREHILRIPSPKAVDRLVQLARSTVTVQKAFARIEKAASLRHGQLQEISAKRLAKKARKGVRQK